MGAIEALGLIIPAVFYGSFAAKMLFMKRRGIDSNLLGRGEKSERARRVEKWLKAITFSGATIQIFSAVFSGKIRALPLGEPPRIIGLFLAATGTAFFLLAMLTIIGAPAATRTKTLPW